MKEMKIYAKVAVSAECLMSVSVIVPAYNEAERISRTILSIRDQSDPPEKIIVVDDGSTDETGLVARRLGITVLRPGQRCGSKAAAQNYALPFVETKYVVAVDADTTLKSDAIEIMCRAMENDRHAIGACSWVQPQRQNTVWNQGRTIEYLFSFTWFKRIQNIFKRPFICSGAFNIFKTSTLKWLGGYPEGTLAEDMDLTWDIYCRGIGYCLFLQEAVAYADEPDTLHNMRRQLNRWSCAYWQNTRKHYRRMWSKDKRIFAFATIGLVDGISGLVFWPFALYIGFTSSWLFPLLAVSIDTVAMAIVAAIGARRFGMSRSVPRYMIGYWVLRPVNLYYYIKWMISGGIFKKSVGKYEKGH